MKAKFAIIFILITIPFLNSCKKESSPSGMPNVAVNIQLDPNSTEYLQLNTVNGWVPITGGYRGIIVFRKSLNEFMAYERACPYDWEKQEARLDVDSSGITTVCPSCKSKYILLDGTPFSGPSTFPMRQYQTTYDGYLLYIYN